MKLFLIFALLGISLVINAQQSEKLYKQAISYLPNNAIAAEKIANVLLEESIKKDDDKYIGKSYYVLGLSNYYNSKYFLSNKYYQKALLSNYIKQNDILKQACYNNRGINYDLMSLYPKALIEYRKSLSIAERNKDSTSICETLLNITLLDANLKHYKEAEINYKIVLAYFLRTNNFKNAGLCYMNLAILYRDTSRLDDAIKSANTALYYFKSENYNYGIVQTLFAIAKIYEIQGLTSEAIKKLLMAQEYTDRSGSQMESLQHLLYVSLAKNYLKEKLFEKAKEYIDKASKLISNKDSNENIDEYYLTKMTYLFKINDYENYLKTQNNYVSFFKKKLEAESLANYNELKTVYEVSEKNSEILNQKNQIESLHIKLYSSILIIFVIVIATIIVLYYYSKIKVYMETLFKSTIKDVDEESFNPVQNVDDKFSQLYNELLNLLENEKLFLNPDLTISYLSKRLNTNEKYISKAINEYSKLNFNSFINKYRIDLAKKNILVNGDKIALKVIGVECGFNNHTTFYRQFKEMTGLTPSQFMDMSVKAAKLEAKPNAILDNLEFV